MNKFEKTYRSIAKSLLMEQAKEKNYYVHWWYSEDSGLIDNGIDEISSDLGEYKTLEDLINDRYPEDEVDEKGEHIGSYYHIEVEDEFGHTFYERGGEWLDPRY